MLGASRERNRFGRIKLSIIFQDATGSSEMGRSVFFEMAPLDRSTTSSRAVETCFQLCPSLRLGHHQVVQPDLEARSRDRHGFGIAHRRRARLQT